MLSRFNSGCDCDCCIVYRSEFCRHWYTAAWERFGKSGTTLPTQKVSMNGGPLDQVGVLLEDPEQGNWLLQNETCGISEFGCASSTDSKSYTYQENTYITPTNNTSGSYLSTKTIANRFQWWLYVFWNSCTSSSPGSCWDSENNRPANYQKMVFIFDYQDKDNWAGMEVEYKPDFGISPGVVDQKFEIRGRQNTGGVYTFTSEIFDINLGFGDTRVDTGIEINIDQRSECGEEFLCYVKFSGVDFTIPYTRVDGGNVALVQTTPAGVIDSITCGMSSFSYDSNFGVYNWVIKYLESEKTDCPSYSVDSNCCGDCPQPAEYDISFSGFTNNDCDICTELNDTFALQWKGHTDQVLNNKVVLSMVLGAEEMPVDEDIPENSTEACIWSYEFDPYNRPECTLATGSQHVGFGLYYLTLIKYQIGTGSSAYALWRLHVGYRLVVRLWETVIDPDGNPIIRVLCEEIERKNWYYDHQTSTADIDNCVRESTDSWSENTFSFDYEDPCDFYQSTIDIDDLCSALGTLTVENG